MPSERAAPRSFLGTGWSFPPTFADGGAAVATVSGAEDIQQSLQILLATRRGERLMQEEFGASLDEVLFAEIDHGLAGSIASLISDAILRHEHRIKLHGVDVSRDPAQAGCLRITLDYEILGANSRYNMVFPFYLNEAVSPGR